MTKFRVGSLARAALPLAHVLVIVVLALGLVPWVPGLHSAAPAEAAPPPDLLISEYVEGSSNNKAIELYNGTGAAINLSAGNYMVAAYNNGNSNLASPTTTVALSGSVANNDVFVLAHSSASFAASADQTTGVGWFNGDDALILWRGGVGGTVVDSFGRLGEDPGSEWSGGGIGTADETLRRKATVCAGDTVYDDAFDPSVEWDGFSQDDFTGLGAHTASCGGGDAAPSVSSTTPANAATGVPVGSDVTVNFSEAVDVTGDWLVLSCTVSGTWAPSASNVTVTGGPQSYTVNPDSDLSYGDFCTAIVYASQVTDQDTDDPPDNMAANTVFTFETPASDPCTAAYTETYTIQGSGAASTYDGSVETTMGVVTGSFQDPTNGRRGFYIQDATGDANDATSDGLFIYDYGFGVAVSAGDLVRVTGTVDEYFGLTEITFVTDVTVCGTGSVGSTTVNLPIPDAVAPADFWEQYEGMLITIPQALTVTEHYELGRYGQVLLATGGRLWQYTHGNLPSVAGYADHLDDIRHRTVYLDDHNRSQNPDPIIHPDPELTASNTLRGGDTVSGLTGALTYTFDDWVIDPIAPVIFDHANPRPDSTPAVGGTVTVASFNVLNYFTTLDTGAPICGPSGDMDCRGAESPEEFTRQRDKIIAALVTINADVVGLMEIENNETAAVQDLVDGLNAVLGAGTYAYIDTGFIGTDAIKVALIYKPGTVSPVGAFAILDSSVDPTFLDDKNRPVLAQTFEEITSGEMFTVAVNHLKSKGSDCNDVSDPDLNDGQGNCNLTRTDAATALAAWLATDPTGSGDPDLLIIGDLNSYAMEDPITALTNAGYTDLLGASEYSYVFSGEWGYLDHALANADLEPQVTGATHWHINADEPLVLDYNENYKTANLITILYSPDAYRASDHDPVLIGLALATEAVAPETGGEPQIDVFDPALSKIGLLPAGGIGLPGEQLTWVITVTNNGGAAGSNIVITDTVRDELRIDSVQTARGTYSVSGQTVTFTIPYLNPGESVEMRIVTTVLSSPLGGVFSNQADLVGTASNGDTVTDSVVATLSPATALPATGYPPADDAGESVPVALVVALLGALVIALAAGGWTLRRLVQ